MTRVLVHDRTWTIQTKKTCLKQYHFFRFRKARSSAVPASLTIPPSTRPPPLSSALSLFVEPSSVVEHLPYVAPPASTLCVVEMRDTPSSLYSNANECSAFKRPTDNVPGAGARSWRKRVGPSGALITIVDFAASPIDTPSAARNRTSALSSFSIDTGKKATGRSKNSEDGALSPPPLRVAARSAGSGATPSGLWDNQTFTRRVTRVLPRCCLWGAESVHRETRKRAHEKTHAEGK